MAYTGTAQQKAGLDIASQRIAQGRGSAADIKNVNYAKSNLGYSFTPVQSAVSATLPPVSNPTQPGQPIDASRLTPNQQLSKILGANVPTSVNSDIAGLLALYGNTTESQKQYDALNQALIERTKALGGQASDLQAALEAQGVPQAFDQIKQLTLKTAQIKGELDQFDAESQQLSSNLENQAIPTGLIQGQQAVLMKQRDLTRASKAAELASETALIQAYQGNADLGQQLAQQSVQLKYAPIQNEIDVLSQQIGLAKDKMNKSDQLRADIIGQLISQKQDEIKIQRQNESDVQDLAIKAATNGAPISVINQIRGMSDPIKAAGLLAPYLKSVGKGETAADTTGFQNIGVEQSARGDAAKLLSQIQTGDVSQMNAFDQLRSAYSPTEASDAALAGLLGINPAVIQSNKYLANPANRQSTIPTSTPTTKKTFRGLVPTIGSGIASLNIGNLSNVANRISSSIGNFLFGKK